MALFDLRDPAALRIRETATRGTLSHALLLTGSGARMELARYAAAEGWTESLYFTREGVKSLPFTD